MTHTPDIISFTPLLRSTSDDAASVERLQAATLEVLERIGVCFPCQAELAELERILAAAERDAERLAG